MKGKEEEDSIRLMKMNKTVVKLPCDIYLLCNIPVALYSGSSVRSLLKLDKI